MFGCDQCAVLTLVGDELRVAASRGFPRPPESGRVAARLSELPEVEKLFSRGRPRFVGAGGEAAASPEWVELAPAGALVQAPIALHGRPLGLLVLRPMEARCSTDGDASTVMAFANQAALILEAARLDVETRRRAAQMALVSAVSQTVSALPDFDQLLAAVVRLIREQLGHPRVNVFLVEGDAQALVLRATSAAAVDARAAADQRCNAGPGGLARRVADTGRPCLCNDVSHAPEEQRRGVLAPTRAELAVPMRVGAAVVGVLTVQSDHADVFHDDDLPLLQIVADQVALAIENARLIDGTRRQIEAMQALHDISLDITSHLDVQEVLAAVLEQAVRFLQAQGSSLAVADRAAGVVRLIAVHNFPPGYRGVELQFGEGAAGRVVVTGQPVIVNDYAHWDGRSPIFDRSPFDAIISVPLRRDGEVIGALSITDRQARRPFGQEDVHLLSLFADLAGIALKNADLYGQVRRAGEVLEQKVEQRRGELAQAREALAEQADQLRQLLRLTVNVQEQERTRLALDLHDGSNQLITGTLYELQAAQESLTSRRPEVALQKLEIAKGLLRGLEAENRRLISGLRPPILDAQGLVPALKSHAAAFQKLFGVACSVRVTGEPMRLPPAVETSVYRIVQEALNNVAAHAQARRVQVEILGDGQHLGVTVVDDGVGFDLPATAARPAGHMGLMGMRERADSIGAQLEIQSQPGAGTRLQLRVPIHAGPGAAEPGARAEPTTRTRAILADDDPVSAEAAAEDRPAR